LQNGDAKRAKVSRSPRVQQMARIIKLSRDQYTCHCHFAFNVIFLFRVRVCQKSYAREKY
jgi:hypothetical protein